MIPIPEHARLVFCEQRLAHKHYQKPDHLQMQERLKTVAEDC